jgi:hypothetical protein
MAKQLHVLDKAEAKWRNHYTAFKQAQPEWQKISNYMALKRHSHNGRELTFTRPEKGTAILANNLQLHMAVKLPL